MIDAGKFGVPRPGTKWRNRSGRPMSTRMKSRHIVIAETARSSPRITTSLIGFH
jgi:hypothetical protein